VAVLTWLADALRGEGFMPHGHCYLWRGDIVALHVVSDSLIALAYLVIPLSLIRFVRGRRDLPFHWIFLCFGLFIVSCGATHVMEVVTLWHPAYWVSGSVKAVTAAASLSTAVVLARLIPHALALPSPAALREANEALTRSEARFRAAAEGSLDAFFLLTAVRDGAGAAVDFRFVEVNARAVALMGVARERLIGASLSASTSFAGVASRIARYAEAVERQTPYEAEEQVAHATEAPRWFKFQVVPLADGVAVSTRDVTALRTQRALELQVSIVRHMPEGVCLSRAADGAIVYVNPAFDRLFGYPPGALEGKNVALLSGAEAPAAPPVERLRAEGAVTVEAACARADGSSFWSQVTTTVIEDPAHGSVVVAVHRDVTGARRAAQERARLAAIVESSEHAILSVTLDGLIESWNGGAARLFGYSAGEVLGRPLATLTPPERADEAPTLRAALGRGEAVDRFETVRMRKGGGRVEVSLSKSPVRAPDGRVVGASVIAEEITARKDAERRLQASLAEKVVLLQEVHHRVKNNLQVISSLLSLQGSHLDDPRAREVVRDSQHRVRSIALLHESLYQTSDFAHLDVGEYLRRLAASLVRTYGAGGRPRLVVETEPVRVELEAAVPLGLIVNELATNALKYAFPDGRPGTLRIHLGATPGGFKLTVADDGVGLPPGFDPHTSPSLGLHIVRTLAEQLDARLVALPGPGTTFVVELGADGPNPPKES
jgi:PAS domain S-box-containing protein